MSRLPFPRLNRLGFPAETPVEFLSDEEREGLLTSQVEARSAESRRRFQAEPRLDPGAIAEAAFGQRPAELQTFMDEAGVPRSPFGPIVQGTPQDETFGDLGTLLEGPLGERGPSRPFAPEAETEGPRIRILDASGRLREFTPGQGRAGFSREELREAGIAAQEATIQPSPFEPEPGPFGSRPTGISQAISRFQKAGRIPVEGESKEAFQIRSEEARFDRINRKLRSFGLPGVGNPAREADIEVSLREADINLGTLLREKAELSAQLPAAEIAETEAQSPELREAAFREALGIRQRVRTIDQQVADAERSLNRATTRVGEELLFAAGRDPIAERIEALKKPEGFVATTLTEGELVPEKVADLMRRERSRERTRAKKAAEAQATADDIAARQKATREKAEKAPTRISVRTIKIARETLKNMEGQPVEVKQRLIKGLQDSESLRDQDVGRMLGFYDVKTLEDPTETLKRLEATQLGNAYTAHQASGGRLTFAEYKRRTKAAGTANTGMFDRATRLMQGLHAEWLEALTAADQSRGPGIDPEFHLPIPEHPLRSLFEGEDVEFRSLTIGHVYDALNRKFGTAQDKALLFVKGAESKAAGKKVPPVGATSTKAPSGSPAFNTLVSQMMASGSYADATAILFTKRPATLSAEEKTKLREKVLPFLQEFFSEGGSK